MVKRKNNIFVLTIIMVTLLLFSGCGLISGDNNKESGFLSGSTGSGKSGVDLTFAENNPLSELHKGQVTTFAFVFTNYQEHDITDMQVKVKNFEKGYVTGLSSDYSIGTIPKATTQTGPGVYSGQIVDGVMVDNFEGKYNFNPVFDYCYSAKSTFREQVCVPSKTNSCDEKVESSKKENGPLKVTVDRVVSVNDKVRLDFTITNSGSGKVVNTCFKTDDYANSYELKVSLGSQTGTCTAVSGQSIINGKSNFYCEFSRTGDDSYASQVVVELDYKYQQSYQKNIVVTDLNEGYQ